MSVPKWFKHIFKKDKKETPKEPDLEMNTLTLQLEELEQTDKNEHEHEKEKEEAIAFDSSEFDLESLETVDLRD